MMDDPRTACSGQINALVAAWMLFLRAQMWPYPVGYPAKWAAAPPQPHRALGQSHNHQAERGSTDCLQKTSRLHAQLIHCAASGDSCSPSFSSLLQPAKLELGCSSGAMPRLRPHRR
jgi:hypothetical protein